MMLPYTIKELGQLIQVCHKNGVRRISFKGLELDFDRPVTVSSPNGWVHLKEPSSAELLEMDKSEKKVEEQLSLVLEDEELDRLQIDDPEQFENMIVQRELEKRGTDEDEVP